MTNQSLQHNTVDLTHEEILRYSRHLLMPEVGLEGQRKLKASSILVIGTGGLGSPVSMYLAAAGIGRIGLVDYDIVDSTNLQRQIVHGNSSIGKRKVLSARDRLKDINPHIQIDIYDEPFTSENAFQISEPYDLIVDGTDNFPTRYLTNDVCVMTGKPNVYGSIFRFEGQVSVFWAEKGPCYRCLFPEPPPPGIVPSCADAGVFGVLPGTIGTLQATEALKLVLGIGEPLIGRLLLYDALAMTLEELRLKKNPGCKVCSDTPEITELIDYEAFCGVSAHDLGLDRLPGDWEIEPLQVAEMLDRGQKIRLIDVREPHELEISNIAGAELIPFGSLASEMHKLDSADEIVLICRSGSRSAQALELLAGAGFRKLKNMRGGINAWADQVDPSLPRY
jgi:molybdopterin/thiamine biosynthesis adenylyltransferase/rhodanese-related sulfurtransferase